MRRRGRAVDRDLHAVDSKLDEAVGGRGVDAAAVGLELDGDVAIGEPREDVPGMRRPERLAAAEGDIGDAGIGDRGREIERLARRQLVAPGPVGTRFLAAREAARAAAIGQLPGKKKGRFVVIDGAPPGRARGRIQVKRMYGWAMTCSETSSSLGVSQTGLSGGVGVTFLA
jgi:hypothetical protein